MRALPALVLAAALAFGGCSRREITPTERKEGIIEASEASFATGLKDWKRAEEHFAKAAAICPDTGDYWLNLGLVRLRLNDHAGARSAYEAALPVYRDAFERNPADTGPVFSRVYILVLLGEADQARSVLEKARARRPDDRRLQAFVENHGLENMVADPKTKANSP
jgi:tetratricopeptide (TPR) repeat protein